MPVRAGAAVREPTRLAGRDLAGQGIAGDLGVDLAVQCGGDMGRGTRGSRALLLVLLTACGVPAPDAACRGSEISDAIAVAPPERFDLLVVIDPALDDASLALASRRAGELVRTMLDGDRDRDGEVDFPPIHDLRAAAISADPGCVGMEPREWVDARDEGTPEELAVAIERAGGVRCGSATRPLAAAAAYLDRLAREGASLAMITVQHDDVAEPEAIEALARRAPAPLARIGVVACGETAGERLATATGEALSARGLGVEDLPLCAIESAPLVTATAIWWRGAADPIFEMCLPATPLARDDGSTRCEVIEEIGPTSWQRGCDRVGREAIDADHCRIVEDRIEGWSLGEAWSCDGPAIQLGIDPVEGGTVRIRCAMIDACTDGGASP